MFVPEVGKTVAELSVEEKNAISHRGRAAVQMAQRLREML
jgi:XTP/dITP diphosphohydrolase